MTTIRKFCCNDFLRFSSVNLVHLVITESTRTYFSWLAQWSDYFNVAVAPGNRIMGYSEGEGWFGQITTVSVHPEYRRRGLGTKLMRMFERQLLDKMYFSPGDLSYSMRCYVGVSNRPARIFFGKFGFQEHRCQSKFISKKEDAVGMRKILVDGGDFDLLRLSTSKELELNREILGFIVQKLSNSIDFVHFSRVCKQWKVASLDSMQYLPLARFPGVLGPGETTESETRRLFCLNCLSGFFEKNADLQIPHRFICSGSAFGWLFLTDDNFNTKLYNPFCKTELNLPSLQTIPNLVDSEVSKSCVYKAMYSSNPSFFPHPFILIIHGLDFSRLAFCRPGDTRWSILNCPVNKNYYMDAVYYKQKFYVLGASGLVIAFDIKCNDQVNTTIIAPPPPGNLEVMHMYLVEVNGMLVKISRELELSEEPELPVDKPELPVDETEEDGADNSDDTDYDETDNSSDDTDDETDNTDDDEICSNRWKWQVVGFRMQRFVDIEQQWMDLEDLGDYSIFVGLNTSFSLRAADFPGCIPNAVYFGGSNGYEMGIFNLSDQSINRHVTNPPFPVNDSAFPYPLWIDHTLRSLLV